MKDAGGVRGKDDEHVSGPVREPAPLALPTMSGSPTSAGSYGSRYAVTKVHFIQVNMTCARTARIHARADQPPPPPNRRIGNPFVGGVGGQEAQGSHLSQPDRLRALSAWRPASTPCLTID